MKIYYNLENERNKMTKLTSEIKKSPNKNIFLEMFDKAAIIETLSNSLKIGEKIKVKIDEKTRDYPNILNTDIPRLIIQKDIESESIPLNDYLKNFDDFEFKIDKKGDEYFLTISKKKEVNLDLKLKFDNDKTIDLNLLTDKKGKDKIFFGVRSYYYIKKEEIF